VRALPVAHLAHLVRLHVIGRASHLRRSMTLKPNNRHTKCSANCSAVPLAQTRTIAPRPLRDRLNYEKPRFAGFSSAPEWTRTTTDQAVHKALNLIHDRKIRPPTFRSSILCGFRDASDASNDLGVATIRLRSAAPIRYRLSAWTSRRGWV
jgi:hypothetical protein